LNTQKVIVKCRWAEGSYRRRDVIWNSKDV